MINENVFIRPHAKGFFIVEFDIAEDKDLILDAGPWFWGNSWFVHEAMISLFQPFNSFSSTCFS